MRNIFDAFKYQDYNSGQSYWEIDLDKLKKLKTVYELIINNVQVSSSSSYSYSSIGSNKKSRVSKDIVPHVPHMRGVIYKNNKKIKNNKDQK